MEHIRLIRENFSQKMKWNLGRCSTKKVRMEYRDFPFSFCSLLHTYPRPIHPSIRVNTNGNGNKNLYRHTRKYKKWCPYRRTDESDNICLSPLCRVHVEWVNSRILRRMPYLWLAREEMMDARIQVTELCEWSMWDKVKSSLMKHWAIHASNLKLGL